MRLSFLVKIAALTLWRSWRMTLVLSIMVVSSVAALVFMSALAVGTNDTMIRNSVGLFTGHIAGSHLSDADATQLQIPGVRAVLLRKQQMHLIAVGQNREPVSLIGIDPRAEEKHSAFWKKTVQGRFVAPGSDTIFIGQDTARRLKIAAGDAVTLLDGQGRPQKVLTVSGIYKTGLSQLDLGLAFCPDSALPSAPTEISTASFLDDNAALESITAQYRQRLPAATFAMWTEFMPDLKQLIDLDSICMAIVIVLVFAIVAVGISCTFLIFTLKNLREHGILKAMGLLPRDTIVLQLSQIGLLTLISALTGAVLGAAMTALFARTGIDIGAFTSHNPYFAVSGILYPRLTLPALAAPPLTAFIFSLLAAVWPIVHILRKSPADILRSL